MVFRVVEENPPFTFRFAQVESGPHENFHYIIGCPRTGQAAVVDPAFNLDQLFALAKEQGLRITTALFTHCHWDHIGGIPEIFDHGVQWAVLHRAGASNDKVKAAGDDVVFVQDGHELTLGDVKVKVLHTPGHQPEGVCFLVSHEGGPAALLGGDTIFIDSCGRTDFPGGDTSAMFDSMARLRRLDPETIVLPGHHYAKHPWRTLGDQVRDNPALAVADRKQFDTLPFLRG